MINDTFFNRPVNTRGSEKPGNLRPSGQPNSDKYRKESKDGRRPKQDELENSDIDEENKELNPSLFELSRKNKAKTASSKLATNTLTQEAPTLDSSPVAKAASTAKNTPFPSPFELAANDLAFSQEQDQDLSALTPQLPQNMLASQQPGQTKIFVVGEPVSDLNQFEDQPFTQQPLPTNLESTDPSIKPYDEKKTESVKQAIPQTLEQITEDKSFDLPNQNLKEGLSGKSSHQSDQQLPPKEIPTNLTDSTNSQELEAELKAKEKAEEEKLAGFSSLDTEAPIKPPSKKSETVSNQAIEEMTRQKGEAALNSSKVQSVDLNADKAQRQENQQLSRAETIKEIITQIVDRIQILRKEDSTETIITLRNPPILEGATVRLTASDNAKREFNISFANLSPDAKMFLDRKLTEDSLTQTLERKGIIVHMLTTTTQAENPLNLDTGQSSKEQQREEQQQQQRNRQEQTEEEQEKS